jgi:hypothetical protein
MVWGWWQVREGQGRGVEPLVQELRASKKVITYGPTPMLGHTMIQYFAAKLIAWLVIINWDRALAAARRSCRWGTYIQHQNSFQKL